MNKELAINDFLYFKNLTKQVSDKMEEDFIQKPMTHSTKKPRKKKLKFRSFLAYYTCYFIFLGFVTTIFLFCCLSFHLFCCTIYESDDIYHCFMRLHLKDSK